MILEQFYLGCLSHASYLIADERTKTAAVVDPQRDVEQYLARARELGVAIRHVILTHFHADFVAGHLELQRRTGAAIHLGARARADYAFEPVTEGDAIDLGDVRLEFLETPGHTPEGISVLVLDRAKEGRRPAAVLTGDTLFIGDVGRPDLMASVGVRAEELAAELYDSLHRKLLALPDETLVYPAHGAGSMCGKSLSKDTVSTIGEQRRHNYALQPMSREAFVALVTADQPETPAYFAYDAALNRKERETLEASMRKALKPLPLDEVVALERAGAHVLDVRDPAEFAAGHLAGSVNIGLGGKFATWAGTLLDPARAIAVIADPGREEEAVMRLGRVGFDRVAGYLDGGIAALERREDLVRRTARITARALTERLARERELFVLDVRTAKEWDEGHIEGSANVPLNQLEQRIGEVPRDRELVVTCRSGYRSSCAASLLARHGITRATDLTGGMEAWGTELQDLRAK